MPSMTGVITVVQFLAMGSIKGSIQPSSKFTQLVHMSRPDYHASITNNMVYALIVGALGV